MQFSGRQFCSIGSLLSWLDGCCSRGVCRNGLSLLCSLDTTAGKPGHLSLKIASLFITWFQAFPTAATIWTRSLTQPHPSASWGGSDCVTGLRPWSETRPQFPTPALSALPILYSIRWAVVSSEVSTQIFGRLSYLGFFFFFWWWWGCFVFFLWGSGL